MFYSVTTGLPAFERVYGQSFYEYQELHPAAAAIFDAAMTSFSALESTAVLQEYDFSGARSIVDVGGGRGALMAAILNEHSGACGTVFDRPEVADGAVELLRRAGIADRCDFVAGDFFEGIPGGGDVYTMKSVLHNWDDENCLSILGNCRDAMGPYSRLLAIERVVPDGEGSRRRNSSTLTCWSRRAGSNASGGSTWISSSSPGSSWPASFRRTLP